MQQYGMIFSAGLFIQWLTEALAKLPEDATDERAGLMYIRKVLSAEGTRPIEVARNVDAPQQPVVILAEAAE